MVRNLPESYLYDRLPDAVVSLDERGLVAAVVGGMQDRLDDLRSYSRKLEYLLDPSRLPDPENNVVLAELLSGQGVVYTRSLDFQSDTPAAEDAAGLTRWVAAQLGVDASAVANARYGRDLYRLVDANTLAYLAETIGAVLHQTELSTAADARQIISTYFPRLRIKGTARSFEVLGRLLGFDDLAFVPLWGRVSPRQPNDPGASANDPDFTYSPEYWPQAEFGPTYSPHVMRDGPFYAWSGTASNGTGATDYYTQVVNGFNPWIEVAVNASINGTSLLPITAGTAAHIPVGVYTLAGGAAHAQAWVDPLGSSFRLRAIAEGESWNGLQVAVFESGSRRVLEVADRLSAIKYRTSYFDLHITTDWDEAQDVFGERSVRPNRDLQADPDLTPDGTALSPFRPWINGSVSTGSITGDWLVRDAHQAPFTVDFRVQAGAADRELPFEAIQAGGLQAATATEEVRPATRFPRRTTAGLLIQDDADYAAYLSKGLLFTTSAGVMPYTGSHARTPLPEYIADISIEPPPILKVTWPSDPGRPYLVKGTSDLLSFTTIGVPVGSSGTSTSFLIAVTGGYAFFFVYDGPTGTAVSTTPSLATNVAFKTNSETDPANAQLGHYQYRDLTLTNLEMSGTYDFSTGTYDFLFVSGAPANAQVYALWTATDTEVIRDEPTYADKTADSADWQKRPEDEAGSITHDVADDYPWLRAVVGGGERQDASMSFQEPVQVQVVSDTAAVYDQSGVAHNLWVVPSGTLVPRAVSELRPTDNRYQPGAPAVGYRGTFRNLAAYTDAQKAVFNTETDLDVLFEPGAALYTVGLAQGVLVADTEHFLSRAHYESLAGWYPFNEHPLDDLRVSDHALEAPARLSGALSTDRLWDADRGWYLRLRPGATATAQAYRGIEGEFTVSFWYRPAATPAAGSVTLFEFGPVGIDLDATTGALTGYIFDSGGSPQVLDTVSVTDWAFVYIRMTATEAFFGVGEGGPASETQVVTDWLPFTTDDLDLNLRAGTRGADLHDLRLWSRCKTAEELEQLRSFQPTPTRALYRPAWVRAVGSMDRYGLEVLPNGWVVPGAMPPWVRHTPEVQVLRYQSSGSYVGHAARKEVGLGGGITEPADVGASFQLGFVFPLPQAQGVYVTAGTHGILPAADGLWVQEDTYPDYVELSGGSTANGSIAVDRAWAPVFWPHSLAKTNAATDAVWVQGDDEWVYRVTLSGAVTPALVATRAWARVRTDEEIAVNPIYRALQSTGTYWDGAFSGTLPTVGGPATVTSDTSTIIVYIGSLTDAEAFTGAVTALRAAAVGVRVAPTGSEVGLPYLGAVGGPATPPWWLYRHAKTLEDAPNAWMTWVYGHGDPDPTQFGNDLEAHPEVPQEVAALDDNGQLDFENVSTLAPGRYRLTLDVGNIGRTDTDFDGFSVEISANGADWIPTRFLVGQNGYNIRGTETLEFEIGAGTPVASPWMLTVRWINAYSDPRRGVKRQLVVYGYKVEVLASELHKVEVDLGPGATQPLITFVTPTAGTHDPTVTGGWFQALDNSGAWQGYRHEVNVFPFNDTGTSGLPLAELLTGSTNERTQDIIVTGITGPAILPDEVPVVAPPGLGSIVDTPV